MIFSTLAGVAGFVGLVVWSLAKHKVPAQHFFDHIDADAEIMKALGQEGSHFNFQVKVQGEIWKARGEQNYSVGEKVKVRRQNDNHLLLDIVKS